MRQRNARLLRQERRDIEDGNPLPPGSYPYETPGDNPVIYADEAGDSTSTYSSPEQRRPGVLHPANCNCAVCAQLRQYLARDRPENPSSCQTGSPPAPAQLPTAMSNPQPASGPVASSSSQSGRWRWVVALLGCLLLAALAAGAIIYRNPLQPAAVIPTPEPALVATPLPATPTMTPTPLTCSSWPLLDYTTEWSSFDPAIAVPPEMAVPLEYYDRCQPHRLPLRRRRQRPPLRHCPPLRLPRFCLRRKL